MSIFRNVTARAGAIAVIVALAALVAGAALHFARLATIPGVNGDEAEYGVLAMARGTPAEFDKPYLGLYYAALVGIATRVFGATAFALRVWPAVAMTLLPLAGLAALRDAPLRARLAAALLLLAHPAFLVFARLGWDVSLLPLAALCACACLLEAARRRGDAAHGLVVVGAAAAGAAATLHPTGWLVVPAFAVAAIGCLRGSGAARWPPPLARIRLVVAVTMAVAVFAVATLPRWRLLAFLVHARLAGDGAAASADARGALAHAGELLSGAMAIRWITGVAPWPRATGAVVAGAIALAAAAGVVLALTTRDSPRAARVAALFALTHLSCGAFALAGVDFAAPGNVRYVIGLYPSLVLCAALCVWLLRVAPPPWARRRAHSFALAAEVAIALVAAASLAGWRAAFWQPLVGAARAVEATFVPGRDVDPKAAAVALIGRLEREAGGAPGALVPKDWHLFQTLRYFSSRRWPTLRIDSHEPRDFATPFADLAARHERLYCVVFERVAGAEEPLARHLSSLAPGLAIVSRDPVLDRAGANVITVYTLARAGPRPAP